MAKIVWDAVGSRIYETGLDRGVLYLSDGSGVAWNGLTGVSEDRAGNAPDPRYLDGVKYADYPFVDDFAATLTAMTYPREFMQFDGVGNAGGGLYLDNQPVGTFGLSYRTLVGSDVSASFGYKIHILYNLTAMPTTRANVTNGKDINPMDFSWTLSAVPVAIPGFRPTAHLIIDSRDTYSLVLTQIENILYGTATLAPRLPAVAELRSLLAATIGGDPLQPLITEPV